MLARRDPLGEMVPLMLDDDASIFGQSLRVQPGNDGGFSARMKLGYSRSSMYSPDETADIGQRWFDGATKRRELAGRWYDQSKQQSSRQRRKNNYRAYVTDVSYSRKIERRRTRISTDHKAGTMKGERKKNTGLQLRDVDNLLGQQGDRGWIQDGISKAPEFGLAR